MSGAVFALQGVGAAQHCRGARRERAFRALCSPQRSRRRGAPSSRRCGRGSRGSPGRRLQARAGPFGGAAITEAGERTCCQREHAAGSVWRGGDRRGRERTDCQREAERRRADGDSRQREGERREGRPKQISTGLGQRAPAAFKYSSRAAAYSPSELRQLPRALMIYGSGDSPPAAAAASAAS